MGTALRSYDFDDCGGLRGSSADDLTHSVLEGEAEDVHKEVDGVARLLAFGSGPIIVFEQVAWMSRQFKVAGGTFEELGSAFMEQRR